MENTWGMRPASLGMNCSAAPAAFMWSDTCPFGMQQFQGSVNETLPTQTHEPLADVLEEIGFGTTNRSYTVLDIKAFTDSLGGRPIYNRHMLRNGGLQLARARRDLPLIFLDCYGKPVKAIQIPKEYLNENRTLGLQYHPMHALTEGFQACRTRDMVPVTWKIYESAKEHADNKKLSRMRCLMRRYQKHWDESGARQILLDRLQNLKHTARITNIVCIALGTLQGEKAWGAGPREQHIMASFLAQELTRMYEEQGMPRQEPITIVAQDPAYTALDRQLLSELPVPIKTVQDPKGFLAINESSLVFSVKPVVPIKQIIADLASEAPDGKGPAAMFLGDNYVDVSLGDLDSVTYYARDEREYYANPETWSYVTMLESYIPVMAREDWPTEYRWHVYGSHWLADLALWAREE